jgi:hypothetical protein
MNQNKGTCPVLDPFEVGEGWFEILLPSLQLVVTDKVPPGLSALAQFTIDRLRLGHGEQIIRIRREWYKKYRAGELTLKGLRAMAPLIAAAVDKLPPEDRPPPAPARRAARRQDTATLRLPGMEAAGDKKPDPGPSEG